MSEALRVWRLRTHLSALMVVTTLLACTAAAVVIMAVRIPELERRTQGALQDQVRNIGDQLELMLSTGQFRLELLESLLNDAPPAQHDSLLDSGRQSRLPFGAVYRLSAQGQVIAAGLPESLRGRRTELLGRDLSANVLFLSVQAADVAWSGRYTSLLGGVPLVGVAVKDPHDGHVLIAELPVAALFEAMQVAVGRHAAAIWLVDRAGELIVDTGGDDAQAGRYPRDGPLIPALLNSGQPPTSFRHEGRDFHAALSYSSTLEWFFIGRAPTGLDNPAVRELMLYMATAFLGSLLCGLLLAPFWTSRLARPLQEIVDRARQTTRGRAAGQHWPRGSVVEFNGLSHDLEKMAATLQEREQKSSAIFNAAPVPMAVSNSANEERILDVNEAWCREYVRERAQVIGRTASELGVFRSMDEEAELQMQLQAQAQSHLNDGRMSTEVWLLRGNGEAMLAQVFGGPAPALAGQISVWATVDIGPMRRIERALRELNTELEARVVQRTEALAAANDALSRTAERLRSAQDELVRAEKMAALGDLVAGVAHEINTPLGNGVMAVSAMADAMRQFKGETREGIKRAELQRLVDSLEQGTDIAARNLRRAAGLVQSFKQVAVDQTTSQRRSFELGEVVHEMVVSLRPSFSRTPYRIEVDVPPSGLRLDSYPGALGQTIGNLIQNAVLHGFDGRDHGTVRVSALRGDDAGVVLRVADDGKGIPVALVGRIFEPFVTTRMGRGGTGLGLHISYNAVVNLLGGTLTVQSVEGEGSCFELRLPVQAPDHPPAGEGR